MSAVAILTCQPNSHPFQERHIGLIEPVKIGRSVARARPAPNNGIFDCKVLSRNHAMLWYENGKFFLQDTKSSNGTFINNQRLCKGGEESAPKEIYSSDHIQFGVDVMENNRRGEKITHGCIIATITLFHPDGREAKNLYSDSSSYCNTVTPGITIQSQELYQLSHYLQEALHREKMLEQKLSTLQQLVNNTQEASENGWQALIDEDRLLSRLEVLENQLHTYSKNHSEDALRQEVVALQEEKLQYETTSKDSLRKVLQEKLEAVRKLTDLERSLSNTEDECSHLKDMCEKSQDELQQLAEKYQDQLKEIQELQEKLHEAERDHKEESERLDREKLELTEKLEDMIKQESLLSAKIESMQAENDIATEQLAAMKAKLEAIKEPTDNGSEKEILKIEKEENEKTDEDEKSDDDKKMMNDDKELLNDEKLLNSHSLDNETEIIPTSQKELQPGDIEGKLRETQLQIEKYKAKLEESNAKLKESKDNVEQLQKELEMAKLDSMQYVAKITSLEEKLKLSDLHMNQMMENAMADLKLQLRESHKQTDGNKELTESLQDKIDELETELSLYRIPQSEKALNVTLVGTSNRDEHLHNNIDHIDGKPSSIEDDESLKELLQEARDLQKKAEVELRKYKDELEETKDRAQKNGEECFSLRVQLTETQKISQERSEMVADLQDQLKKAETTTKEVKQQILTLRDRLLEEQAHARTNQEEINHLTSQLDQEKSKHKETKKELEESKQKLVEVQQAAKQSHNESEQNKTEFAALKEECASLRKRIQAIEAEMKMSRKENLQLSSEYNKLQESYKQLEVLKTQLENREVLWKNNLTDSQKETEQTKQEITGLSEEIAILRSQCETYKSRIAELECEINNATLDYKQLADRSKVLSFCSSIPLLMLLFAVLMALYPTLAQITATT